MKAVILAAGQGTRLRPLTDDRPKCLVELVGVPLLHRQLAVLRAAGVTDISVVTGYRADLVAGTGCRTVFNPDFAGTNMVVSLFCAGAAFDGTDDTLVVYGDLVFERRVIETLMACSDEVGVIADRCWRTYWAARMPDPLADAETFRMDGGGRIVELGRKPQGYDEIEAQYTGLFKVRADRQAAFVAAFEGLKQSGSCGGRPIAQAYMTDFIQHLIDSGWPVRAVLIDNGWLEVDSVADLELYERLNAEGTLSRFCRLGTGD